MDSLEAPRAAEFGAGGTNPDPHDGAATHGAGRLAAFLRSPALLAIVLFCAGLFAYTRNNTFAFYYHPDESGKVEQIARHSRNFNHPLLLLSTTELLMRVGWISRDSQKIVEVGRFVSAVFSAAAVAALALLAFMRYGPVAGWCAGAIVGVQPDVFKYAHFMKEDPALLLGMALSLLAIEWHRRAGTRHSLIALGIAAALSLSAKYLGLIMLPMALWAAVRWSPAIAPRDRWKLFAWGFLLTLAVVNYSVFSHVPRLFKSIGRETSGVVHGHRGMTRAVPHADYIRIFVAKTDVLFRGLCAAYYLILAATWRRRTTTEWITAIFPLVFVAILSCSPKVSDRYSLPFDVLMTVVAAMGAFEIAQLFRPRALWPLRVAICLAATTLLFRPAWATMVRMNADFATDDHGALRTWIEKHLPADASIAEDARVNLPDPNRREFRQVKLMTQRVLMKEFIADFGSLEALREQGYTYVAVCRGTYARFFDEAQAPQSSERAEYDARRAFYERLFHEGELVWERPISESGVIYTRPGLRLYRIIPAAPAPAR